MKIQDILKEEIDSIGDDHVSSNIDNPIKKDAFDISDEDKIRLIEQKMYEILDTLGMDQ